MVGVEFIDPSTGAPDHDLAEAVMIEAFRKGLLVLTCGPSTVRFCPPLTITPEQADEAVERFALAIEACLAR
jgi:4-aminobutyrate aminotransferase